MWAKKVDNDVSGVFPNVRGALAFAVESQDGITAAAVALGVPGLGAETSTEIDAHLFVVLSALTDSESFDVVLSAEGGHGFESWRKLHRRYDPFTAVRARSLSREILSPTRVKLSELMGAIERMEDLVRRYCSGRDAQGNAHTLAADIRLSSLEALLPDDLERAQESNEIEFVQFPERRDQNVLRIQSHASARTKQKGPSHPGGDDPTHWCCRQRQRQAEQRQARQGQRQRPARTARTRTARTGQEQGFDGMLELWKARTSLERLLE